MYTDLAGHAGKAIYHGDYHVGWANVENEEGDIVMEEAIAKACMMAAAPEMYQLLGKVKDYFENRGIYGYGVEESVSADFPKEIKKVMRKALEGK